MKKILLIIICIVFGQYLNAQNHRSADTITIMPKTGYIKIGDKSLYGFFTSDNIDTLLDIRPTKKKFVRECFFCRNGSWDIVYAEKGLRVVGFTENNRFSRKMYLPDIRIFYDGNEYQGIKPYANHIVRIGDSIVLSNGMSKMEVYEKVKNYISIYNPITNLTDIDKMEVFVLEYSNTNISAGFNRQGKLTSICILRW